LGIDNAAIVAVGSFCQEMA